MPSSGATAKLDRLIQPRSRMRQTQRALFREYWMTLIVAFCSRSRQVPYGSTSWRSWVGEVASEHTNRNRSGSEVPGRADHPEWTQGRGLEAGSERLHTRQYTRCRGRVE